MNKLDSNNPEVLGYDTTLRGEVLAAVEAQMEGPATTVPNPMAETAPAAGSHERNQAGFIKKRTMAIIGVVGVLGGGAAYLGLRGGNDSENDSTASTSKRFEAACSDVQFPTFKLPNGSEATGAASNGDKYFTKSYLPKSKGIDTQKEAAKYVEDLLTKEPLGGKGDKGSMAALMATLGLPSHDGAGVGTNPDPKADFRKKYTEYTGAGGLESYKADCALLADTLPQVSSYFPGYLNPGDIFTSFDALRDEKNQTNNAQTNHNVSEEVLNVILIKLPKVLEDLDDFTEFGLVVNDETGEWTGRIVYKGLTIGENGSKAFEGEIPEETNPELQGVPGGETQAPGLEGDVQVPAAGATVDTEDQNGVKTSTRNNGNGTVTVTKTNPSTGKTETTTVTIPTGTNPGGTIPAGTAPAPTPTNKVPGSTAPAPTPTNKVPGSTAPAPAPTTTKVTVTTAPPTMPEITVTVPTTPPTAPPTTAKPPKGSTETIPAPTTSEVDQGNGWG